MKYFLTPQEQETHAALVGNKSKGLSALQQHGFSVPSFFVMPASVVADVVKEKPDTVLTQEVSNLGAARYVVRSNMIGEDSDHVSYAGYFRTYIDLSIDQVPEAIYNVIAHATEERQWDLNQCSIIVQEYIEADIAGVCFTRDPQGGIGFVLEYHRGRGEEVVSGAVTPEYHYGLWTHDDQVLLPRWKEMKSVLQRLEKVLGHPQDIEWCIVDDRWFLLQTRHITTIESDEYVGLKKVEQELSQMKQYRFVQNDLTDTLGEAVPLMESIARLMVDKDGPVANAYKRHGIRYVSKNFLHVFSTQFYVDAEAELQSVLPAFSLLNRRRIPRWKRLRQTGTTFRNIVRLALLKGNIDIVASECQECLTKVREAEDISSWKRAFTSAYESVFDINVLYGTELKRFEALVSSYEQDAKEIIQTIGTVHADVLKILPPDNLEGNSISLVDTSETHITMNHEQQTDKIIVTWFASLPSWKQAYIQKKADMVLSLERLREVGRWISISYISQLRHILKDLASERGVSQYQDLFFLSLTELEGEWSNKTMTESIRDYKDRYVLPPLQEIDSLGHPSIHQASRIQGLSPGKVQGVLVTKEGIEEQTGSGSFILYTQTLSPSLSPLLDRVVGIYAERGGMLSHLAIVAREQGIPVIVGPPLSIEMQHQTVEIDGSSGSFHPVNK